MGVLAGGWNSDGAWEVPVQVAQDVGHPAGTHTTVTHGKDPVALHRLQLIVDLS